MILSSLHGKLALVTAGTKGIGHACVEYLLEMGLDVVVMGRNIESLHKLSVLWHDKKSQASSNHLYTLHADHLEHGQMREKLIAFINSKKGIDIIINVSGGPESGPLLDVSAEYFTQIFTQHILTSHTLAQIVIPHMKKNNWGRIVNIISTSVKAPLENLGASNTIRGAMASWCKSLANEVGQFGITVNGVLPGAIETDRLKEIIQAKANKAHTSYEHVAHLMQEVIPAKRFGSAQEVASLVGYLVSPTAQYVNGSFICIDGGRTPNI